MIFFNLHITNPFHRTFNTIKSFYGDTFLPYKKWECNIYSTSDIIGLMLNVTTRSDHAGIHFQASLFGLSVDLAIYDSRHWCYITNTWKDPE